MPRLMLVIRTGSCFRGTRQRGSCREFLVVWNMARFGGVAWHGQASIELTVHVSETVSNDIAMPFVKS